MCNNEDNYKHKCSCRGGRMSRLLIPALLLLLSEEPSHGYELTENYSKLGFTDADADPGAIYRTLKLLESEGFIKSKWETETSGPAKKIYSITPEGSEILSGWVAELKKRRKTLDIFLDRYNKLKL